MNVEDRLKMDDDLKYEKLEVNIEQNGDQDTSDSIGIFKRNLINTLKNSLHTKQESHNRLVCIADRREKYYDFKLCGPDDKQKYLTGLNPGQKLPNGHIKPSSININTNNNTNTNNTNNTSNKPPINDDDDDDDEQKENNKDNNIDTYDLQQLISNDEKLPIIELDKTKLKEKKCDEFYIFQPPREYGQFNHEYGQEHLQYLSREYMLPPAIIKDVHQGVYAKHSGTYNSFNSQMFTLSFCCHSKNDIRLHWYINGWNMRIPKISNFVKIWPEFFEKDERDDEKIKKIKEDLLSQWRLKIKNKEYEAYEKDLLRFDRNKNKQNGQNDDVNVTSPKNEKH